MRGYRPKQAQQLADSRRNVKENATRITIEIWQKVGRLLRLDWSPKQISGTLKQLSKASASHEPIYQYVYADKQQRGDLYKHLRCRKKRRKRYSKYDRCGQISNRQGLDQCPAVLANKTRLGDWEANTIIGKHHQQTIISLVERQSKHALLAKSNATPKKPLRGRCLNLKPLADRVHTITSDNGREFTVHAAIAEALRAE